MGEMKPGRSLDGLVIEVMGWKRVDDCPLGDLHCPGHYETPEGKRQCCPPVSTEAAPAMLGWEWLENNNPWKERETECLILFRWEGTPTVGRIYSTLAFRGWMLHREPLISGETYPHAIALAVLSARKRN